MGYVAVEGGENAINNAKKVVEIFRRENRLAVDQAMGEGSLYAPELAELAIKQAEGDLMEASFLIRAYRSTLPRIGYSEPIDTRDMFVVRQISSTFRDIPGGQILGATRDYTQRLLEFEPSDEVEEEGEESDASEDPPKFEKIVDVMRGDGLIAEPLENPEEPFDITRDSLQFPLPRSARLQALARGESGAMLALAYSSLRGYGSVHPTIAELRVGYVKVKIKHPYTKNEVSIGEILATECEGILSGVGATMLSEDAKFSLGYGLVFGQNERKAISMAILDGTTSVKEPKAPSEDQEFVFYHIDGVDAMGFVEHLKLPHYVTFQSSLDRVKKVGGKK
ncbi:MAG TPA: carbon-phosphorus lyase [Methanophagales archaeon]|nr:carbon-phosphorus lyase [Methanophagales archaeon]